MRTTAVVLIAVIVSALPVSGYAAGHCHHEEEDAVTAPSPSASMSGAEGAAIGARSRADAPSPASHPGPAGSCACLCHTPFLATVRSEPAFEARKEAHRAASLLDAPSGFPRQLDRPPRA